MQMTDSEILTNWRNSGGEKKQIQVLAELCGVSWEEMKAKLTALGALAPEKAAQLDFQDAARALYEQGLTDGEIAAALHRKDVSGTDVTAWRRSAGLTEHRKKRNRKGAEAPDRGSAAPQRILGAAAVSKILGDVVGRCPRAEILVAGTPIFAIECRSRFGADGKEQVTLELLPAPAGDGGTDHV